jgi:crotonobetainyl-CoA:carnitine CoA-transferase CaiB-like acyl-CoA transferase
MVLVVQGEMSERPAFDFIAQALSGFMSLNGTENSGPMRAAMPISDLVRWTILFFWHCVCTSIKGKN